MIILIRFPNLLPVAVMATLFVSCTGEPNKDTILFSTKQADIRHDRMRGDIHRINRETERERIETITKKGTLAKLDRDNRSITGQISILNQKRNRLIQEKAGLDVEIANVRKEGREDKKLLQKRSDLESEIDETNDALQKLIQIQ